MNPNQNTDLIHRQTATQLAAQWEGVKARLTAALSEIADCEATLNHMIGAKSARVAEHMRYGRVSFTDPTDLLGFLEGHIWQAVFDRTEIWQILSVAKTEELRGMLKTACDPLQRTPSELGPVSAENVVGVLIGLRDGLKDYIEDAMGEVYDALRPRGKKTYKRNDPNKGVGRRVVLPCVVEKRDRRWAWAPHVNWEAEPQLRAIDRVFHLLDGKGYASKTYGGELYNGIKSLTPAVSSGETTYFRFTAHINGNLHLEFKRLDLLAELNRRGGDRLLKKGSDQ